ncbi:IS66 family insertion sequence element accessory protein TnpB, partial [Bradyrhizobium sp. CIR3A]|uniref:IS66 family insertion sequence element accessory protein TnpB n=1 Tax=Bradyrhizobium sp. CIR3A TaxID=2663838 RepID=UPI001AEDF341
HPSDRNTDERDGSPSQAATGLMNRSHFRLSYKRLDRGKFIWPSASDGAVSISAAQMAYMLEGIDWRNPQLSWRPSRAG